MSIHEQARAEAEKRYPVRMMKDMPLADEYDENVEPRATFFVGFLAGHEAATRTRVVSTVTELDALPVGSVVLDNSGIAIQRRVTGWWTATGAHSLPTGIPTDIIAAEGLPAHVLYDPEETR